MLKLGSRAFTTARSTFSDSAPEARESTAKVYVRIQFPGSGLKQLAQLDTGAAWSVMDQATAEAVEGLELTGQEVPLRTLRGEHRGPLVRLVVTLLADEGDSLEVESTFMVCQDWPPGEVFLGYGGFLDRIRFALDPQANLFYFGPSGPTE